METLRMFLLAMLIILKFKSYYVVWKLNGSEKYFGEDNGLNRTMQYGNKGGLANILQNPIGLNRTMQYGNPCESR